MYVLIYDGTCNLCATFVRWLGQVDQGQRFTYVPMQDTATLAQWQITPQDCDQGMILLDPAAPHQRWQGSDAAEEIGRLLPVAQGVIKAYRALPGAKSVGDGLYAFIRDHRYKLFGGRPEVYESEYPACESDRCAKF